MTTEEKQEFINKAWQLVSSANVRLLITEDFGIMRAYYVTDFIPKSRDVFYNEARNCQDVTEIVNSLHFNLGIQQRSFLEQAGSIAVRTFKFGHDNFLLLERNELNATTNLVNDSNSSSGYRIQ